MALQDCLEDMQGFLTAASFAGLKAFLGAAGLEANFTAVNDILISLNGTVSAINAQLSIKNGLFSTFDTLSTELVAFLVAFPACASEADILDLQTKITAKTSALTTEITGLTDGLDFKNTEIVTAQANVDAAQQDIDDQAALKAIVDVL